MRMVNCCSKMSIFSSFFFKTSIFCRMSVVTCEATSPPVVHLVRARASALSSTIDAVATGPTPSLSCRSLDASASDGTLFFLLLPRFLLACDHGPTIRLSVLSSKPSRMYFIVSHATSSEILASSNNNFSVVAVTRASKYGVSSNDSLTRLPPIRSLGRPPS